MAYEGWTLLDISVSDTSTPQTLLDMNHILTSRYLMIGISHYVKFTHYVKFHLVLMVDFDVGSLIT